MFKIFVSLLYYELLLFFRDKKIMLHSLGFFIIVTLLFPLALSPHTDLLRKFAPGILWVSALLASLLALENWLRSDLEDQALEQLLLSSFPLSWLISAKMAAFWLAITLPLILTAPILGLLLHLSWPEIFVLILTLLTGTPALITLGATCKTLILSLQQQGSLLSLLVLPLSLPVLIMSVTTLMQTSLGLPILANLAFLSGISLLCLSFLPSAIAYILRWGMEG